MIDDAEKLRSLTEIYLRMYGIEKDITEITLDDLQRIECIPARLYVIEKALRQA